MKIVTFLAQSFYCVGVMMASGLAALVISIRYYSRHRDLRIFTYYIAFSLLQDLTAFYAYPYTPTRYFRMAMLSMITNAFMLFEFIVCSLFILRYLLSPLRRWVVRINTLLFLGLMLFVFIHAAIYNPNKMLEGSSAALGIFFLVIPCLIYFYELFVTVNLQPLKNQPAFWVVTGLLFLTAGDTVVFLTTGFLGEYGEAAFSLNYILYSTFFILLIRAYLCIPENCDSREPLPNILSSGTHAESV